jgi:2-polyprenyl-6-hydroxyphenyl methylase/3-demethylubiquinone-9 3-methyltransferase
MLDHTVYERQGVWWGEDALFNIIFTVFNPGRSAYIQRILATQPNPTDKLQMLDVGCGGGYLAESLAAAGASVSGIDTAHNALVAARTHAQTQRYPIQYSLADGERLPFADATFDVVYCCDVLQHVPDVARIVAESARVLKRGGLYFFQTINRTPLSYLALIVLAQRWDHTSFLPLGSHQWSGFVPPSQLIGAMTSQRLTLRELLGFKSPRPLTALYQEVRRYKRGEISYDEFGRRIQFDTHPTDLSVSYIGYAQKL